jgi:hypothetical protein
MTLSFELLRIWKVFVIYFEALNVSAMGRDSSVDIATRNGLGGPEIESRRGRIFRARPDRSSGPTSFLYSGYRRYFPGVKRPGRGVDHPPPSSAGVKERVEIYLCSPLKLRGLLWGEIFRNFS